MDTEGIIKHIADIVANGRSPEQTILESMRAIKNAFLEFYWVGVYVLFEDELRLGPYVGPKTDHVRIPTGRGVCGTAVAENRNQVIGDVREIANYLACNIHTRSEIVVLVRDSAHDSIIGQIDIDCTVANRFGQEDEEFLDNVGRLIAPAMKALRDGAGE